MTTTELAAVAWGFATRPENPMPVTLACEWLTDRAERRVADALGAGKGSLFSRTQPSLFTEPETP